PLFSAVLNYRHSGPEAYDEGTQILANHERSNYPFVLSVDDLGEAFELSAQVHRSVGPDSMMGYVHAALQSLVQSLELTPDTDALQLEVLPQRERRQLLETFNDTDTPLAAGNLIHELFEEQVRRQPDAVAVAYEGCVLSY